MTKLWSLLDFRTLAKVLRLSLRCVRQMAAAVVMSMTPFIYGTTLSFGGLLLAESQLADKARLSIGDAVMIAAASNFGRMAGEWHSVREARVRFSGETIRG